MKTDDLAQWRIDNVPAYNRNKMKLGVFATNVSNGTTMTEAPTSFVSTYDHNVEIAKLADSLGFELLVPVGRWKHFGGSTTFNGNNIEVFTWATAMACNTTNIMVCATSHTPTAHPLFAAKQAASIDNISKGRFGLNIVCGWFKPEIEMFGKEQLPHGERYQMADEWVTCVKRAWTEQDFTHTGKYYSIKDGYLSPKPIQQPGPILLNAGNSEVIGLQYHPDYEYFQMINLIAGRKERLFTNKNFLNEDEYISHISYIKSENELLNFKDRTCEVRNWLNYIKN